MLNLIRFLLLSLLISGCAVKTTSISLFSPEPPMLLKCGDALSSTLGFAPVLDQRPDHEKTGQKPKGVFLGVWNQRIGEYITSDRDFLDNVPDAFIKQMMYTIEKSNCFYELKVVEEKLPLQPNPEELLVIFAKTKIRYVLLTELKHFYGTQYQHSHLAIIPTPYVSAASHANAVGNAQGFTEMFLTLYDTQMGQEVWRGKIEASADSQIKGDYPQAAKDSLQKASEDAAKMLHQYVQSLSRGLS